MESILNNYIDQEILQYKFADQELKGSKEILTKLYALCNNDYES
jgi:hypothetical protein